MPKGLEANATSLNESSGSLKPNFSPLDALTFTFSSGVSKIVGAVWLKPGTAMPVLGASISRPRSSTQQHCGTFPMA
eukprot:CAMPEP_0194506210 /NCGR_PEP_ID=MMETSP0253-20130528/34188_1 /TAXON_ID=2966 /ORGANISM="Noctiluca scintillans" /LENGTH=76 /DNA_ID=CAMNT_0039348889 /DNA_START=281 /DNA_END=508 /DNA_ORIENTATION=+